MSVHRIARVVVVLTLCFVGGLAPAGASAREGGSVQSKPEGAASVPVAERQSAWRSLSAAEQEEKVKEFIELVGPAVQRAIREGKGAGSAALPRQVVGRGARGVFTLPTAPVSGLAAEPSFLAPEAPEALPCNTRDCEGDQPPQVTAAANPAGGPAPLTVQFSRLAYAPGGYIISTFWDFGDGSHSSQANPSHTYTAPGSYFVLVEVTDNRGEFGWDFLEVTVGGAGPGNQPPIVSLSASPTSGTAPLTVQFTASASDPDGWITAYNWTFGDGSSSTGGATASHTYSTVGAYSAGLEVIDNLGASVRTSITIQVLSAVGDADNDGLDDSLEDALATGFLPYYHVSSGEQAGTGFARFQNTGTLTILQNLPAVPPAVHWRVSPLFVASINGVAHQFLQVDYLTVWNRDDGLSVGGLCRFNAAILGGLTGYGIVSIVDGLGGHAFDQERSATLLAAPVASAHDPAAYRSYHYYAAAHEGTITDHSYYAPPPFPLPPGNHVELWFSRAKHGSYFGNPDYLPLIPGWLISLTYWVIDDLYWYYGIPYWDYVYYLAIADTVFYGCVVERFGEQGASVPSFTLNVGEPGRPLNGSAWIADPRIASKLQPLWVLVP